jgi:hypothetical protein
MQQRLATLGGARSPAGGRQHGPEHADISRTPNPCTWRPPAVPRVLLPTCPGPHLPQHAALRPVGGPLHPTPGRHGTSKRSALLTLKCTLGWKIFVPNRTPGGTNGYCSGTLIRSSKVPPSKGVSGGPCNTAVQPTTVWGVMLLASYPCQRRSAVLWCAALRSGLCLPAIGCFPSPHHASPERSAPHAPWVIPRAHEPLSMCVDITTWGTHHVHGVCAGSGRLPAWTRTRRRQQRLCQRRRESYMQEYPTKAP